MAYMAIPKGSRMYRAIFAVSLLLFQLSVEQVEKRHLYVKPSPVFGECPHGEACLTLSEYLQNVSDFLNSNTAIHFLPGNHTLSSSKPNHDLLFAVNVHDLSLLGHSGQNTILNCTGKVGIAIINAVNIHISNIMITNCGQMITTLLNETYYEYSLTIQKNTKAALAFFNVYSLMLQSVKIEGSHGYGLFGVDVGGNSNLTNCTFSHNGWKQIDSSALNTEKTPGGNALFVYPCSIPLVLVLRFPNSKLQHTLNISHCEFAHGIDTTSLDFETWHKSSYRVSGGSGLGILFYYSGSPGFYQIHIADSTFHHNESPYGPGANMLQLFDIHRPTESLFDSDIVHINVFINKCDFNNGEALEGGGMFIGHIGSGRHYPMIRVSNSTLSRNTARTGGGLHFRSNVGNLYMRSSPIDRDYLSLINCNFSSNRAVEGAGVHVSLLVQSNY